MSEDFETAGIRSETWWSSPKNVFAGCPLPCSSEIDSDMGNFAWQDFDALFMKQMLSCTNSNDNNNSNNGTKNGNSACFSDMCFDSTLQMIGFGGFSSPTTSPADRNQSLPDDIGRNQGCDSSTEEEMNPSNLFEGLFDSIQPTHFSNNLSNELLSSSWAKTTMLSKPLLPDTKQEKPSGPSFSNNNHFFNEPTATPILHCTRPTFEEKSPTYKDLIKKTSMERVQDTEGMCYLSPPLKRPRLETLSPLPSFKFRKEKLGDRITALQQLVSPFGKTDTASVLHEAIEYIKFLHDQVTVLSTAYMKHGPSIQHQQSYDKSKDQDSAGKDLRSRGLCLVPISSTFLVANEINSGGFWNPSLSVALR